MTLNDFVRALEQTIKSDDLEIVVQTPDRKQWRFKVFDYHQYENDKNRYEFGEMEVDWFMTGNEAPKMNVDYLILLK
jgi:hypothetical protein